MHKWVIGFGCCAALAACGDPLRNFDRLSDVPATEASANVAQAPGEARAEGGGLFARLLNRRTDDPTNAAVEAALSDAMGDEAQPENAQPEATEPEAAPRRGLFGGIFGGGGGGGTLSGDAPEVGDVPEGAILPFGQIARVCGLRESEMGRRISAGAGFEVYDTVPTATAPRPFYITGFSDNCARTFTGAVVIPGDIETHEFVRYQPSNESIRYTTVDNAYEALKASVCRVGRGQPCGARSDRLNRNTQFITVYNFFGGTFSSVPTEWTQILIHDGEVLAISVKDG